LKPNQSFFKSFLSRHQWITKGVINHLAVVASLSWEIHISELSLIWVCILL